LAAPQLDDTPEKRQAAEHPSVGRPVARIPTQVPTVVMVDLQRLISDSPCLAPAS
jgi:hypothetical protein